MTEHPARVESDMEAGRPASPTIAAEDRPSDASISARGEPVTTAADSSTSARAEPATTPTDASSAASLDDAADDGFLDDLVLPSLVSAPEPLVAGAEIGPDG